jgi:hypothetical protein
MQTMTLKMPSAQVSSIPQEDGWYTVTPDIATEWEATNHNARDLSLGPVNQFARDIKNDHWEPNGEPVQFDEDGKMINGFHRMRACIVAQRPFRTYVVTGIPRGTKTYDLGYKRTHGQIFRIEGKRYGNVIAATARLLWKYERGPRTLLDNRARPTLHDVWDLLAEHPLLEQSVELVAGSFQKAGRLTRSSSIPPFIHYLGSKKHGELATDFVELVHKGVEPSTGRNQAAYLLRERLIEWQRQRVRASQNDYLGLWIPAWNAFVKGGRTRYLTPVDWSGEAPGSKIE